MVFLEVEDSDDILRGEGLINLSEVDIFPFLIGGDFLDDILVGSGDVLDDFLDKSRLFFSHDFLHRLKLFVFLKLCHDSFPNFA
jgi:hypothetical protein